MNSLNTSKKLATVPAGRRVVEWQCVIDGLEECDECGEGELSLRNIEDETVCGLASILHVRCSNCDFVNKVITGKRHNTTENGPVKCFDVNTKLAAGIYEYECIKCVSLCYSIAVQNK